MQAGGPWPCERPDRWQHPTTRHGNPDVFPCPEGGVHRCCMDNSVLKQWLTRHSRPVFCSNSTNSANLSAIANDWHLKEASRIRFENIEQSRCRAIFQVHGTPPCHAA